MAEVTVGGVTFTYSEASFGKSRGIQISAPGHETRRYNFKPNPHNEDKWYNKNQGLSIWRPPPRSGKRSTPAVGRTDRRSRSMATITRWRFADRLRPASNSGQSRVTQEVRRNLIQSPTLTA